ncbi:Polyadenylate-binding protein-interacting protein 9, partial [Stylosanthes scabra]|nr:Polyadenylate-binding protein-interacting protein 9 [Stylosanthes scabra]
MSAVADVPTDTTAPNQIDSKPKTKAKSDDEFNVQKLVDIFTKLNPLAKEFFPSSYSYHDHLHQGYYQFSPNNFMPNNKPFDGDSNQRNRRRRASFNQVGKRLNGRVKAQREDSVKRTVYVSDIDQHVTEERLAALFSTCGQVIDCRICGDPHSVLRFAFVEFTDEEGARAGLRLGGTVLGYYPLRVLPSKTAILPVNPTFLPRSADERKMCTRTVYCTNIDKKVSQTEVKTFFESSCGEVTRLRLLGDRVHSTRIAFVEFAMAESAIIALNCSGMLLGNQPV